jgi:hypothetical protein
VTTIVDKCILRSAASNDHNRNWKIFERVASDPALIDQQRRLEQEFQTLGRDKLTMRQLEKAFFPE